MSRGVVISHWYQLFGDFNTSAVQFYAEVVAALERRDVPEVSTEAVLWKEGGVLSARREYLRVQRGKHAFDICGAPFGNGFFFSWWFAKLPPPHGILEVVALILVCLVGIGIGEHLLMSMFRGSCVGIALQIAFLVFGLPAILYLLGYLVHAGEIGEEEWVLSLPILGRLYEWAFNPLTYYRYDTALMFQETVRAAVNEVIDGLRSEKGLRV